MDAGPAQVGPDLLARLQALGPYFAPAALGPRPGAPWSRVERWTAADGSGPLPGLIDRMRAALAAANGLMPDDVHPKVAASSVQLAVAARIVSPVVALATLAGRVPAPSTDLWLAGADGHQVEAGWSPGARLLAHPATPDVLVELLVDGALRPFGTALHAITGLSMRVVAGNTASALRGAATVIGSCDPALGGVARAHVDALLDRSWLAGAGEYRPDGGWRRRSCCLFYRLPHGGLCGDCVLHDAAERRRASPAHG